LERRQIISNQRLGLYGIITFTILPPFHAAATALRPEGSGGKQQIKAGKYTKAKQ
jgi:hypothetical protein